VLRMVMGGVFERFPGLQVLVGHMGENLPFSLARADGEADPPGDWAIRFGGGYRASACARDDMRLYN